jgi:anti-sigma-K factor RskA
MVPEADDLLAAELAFGLLDPRDRADAERRVALEPALAGVYQKWQDYAAALAAGNAQMPPSSLWPSIQARIAANDTVALPTRAALRGWQAGTVVAIVAALGLGALALQRPSPPLASQPAVTRDAPPLVAILKGDANRAIVVISLDRSSNHLSTVPTGLRIGDHSAELWVIPKGGKPSTLGLVATDKPDWKPATHAAKALIREGAVLAISVEPIGGSPTGQPTGPVILTGAIEAS